MVRPVLEASIANTTAVLCALLSSRGARSFAGPGYSAVRSRNRNNYRSRPSVGPSFGPDISFDSRRSLSCSPDVLYVDGRRYRGSRRQAVRALTSVTSSLIRPRGNSIGKQPTRASRVPASSMSATATSSSSPREKRHRNTFLLPRADTPVNSADGDGPLALVILNVKADDKRRRLLRHLWDRAVIRVCADGGANRLHDSFDGDSRAERASFVPDMIVGDLDSLRPEVAAFYEELGCEVKRRDDQDHNDFEKCLLEIEAKLSPSTADEMEDQPLHTALESTRDDGGPSSSSPPRHVCPATVVALGAFGGRFDHEMAGMSLLHTYTSRFDRLLLMGAGNVAFLLIPGLTHVVEPNGRFEGPTVGLIPIGGPCKNVKTKGLKWNLEGNALEFGVLVSSSNCVVEDEVVVRTDAPLVWTAEFNAAEWIEAVVK